MARLLDLRPRRGTAATWVATNPILNDGEIGFESDTGLSKLGDGATAWNSLPYPRPPGLPSYAPQKLKGQYNSKDAVYNFKASNTRRFRKGQQLAATGGISQEVVIGASAEAGANNQTGPVYDRLNAWPMIYRNNVGLPIGGTGWVRTCDFTTHDARWVTGAWTLNGTDVYASGAIGTVLTFTADRPGTSFQVAYYSDATFGGFTLAQNGAVSGAGFGTAAAAQSAGIKIITLTTPVNVGDVFTIKTTSTAITLVIAGQVIAASGLIVHNVSQSGSKASSTGNGSWTDTSNVGYNLSLWPSNILYGGAAPSAIHIDLGPNDYFGGATLAAIKTAITTVRNAFPNSDCFLYLAYHINEVSAALWPAYAAAMYELADALDVPLFDMFDRIGYYTDYNPLGYAGDTIAHLTPAGYGAWGRGVAEALAFNTRAYEETLVTRDYTRNNILDPPRWITRVTGTVTSTWQNLVEISVNGALSFWQNEWGAIRGTPHANSKFDAILRAFRRDDLAASTHQGAGFAYSELISNARDRQFHGRGYLSGELWREAVKHMDLFVWKTGDPDPTTDATGQFGYGAGSTGYTQSISPTTFVILIQNVSTDATPTWAPAGRTLRFNLA